MAPIESGGINVNSPKGIRHHHHHHHVLKKGPWTTSEDMILVEYVKKHGEGNWNAVQRNSGLMRGGKSCRLRWANHLRPNLKKGAFTPEEENIIVQLHAKMGNKWARMAAQLPGRTDNEIKNYWNTRLKRRQRAGLPIYPREIRQEQQRHHHQFSSSPPQSSLSPLIASSNAPNPNPLRFFNAFASPSPSPSSHHFINQSLASFYGNSSSSNLSLLPMPSLLQYSSSGAEISMLGLPSIQSMPAVSIQDRTITPVESCNDFVMATTPSDAGCAEDYEIMATTQCNKSGLLEDLLGESHQKLPCCPDMADHESFIAAVGEEDDEHQQTQSGFGFGHNGDSQANNHGYDQSKETNVDEDLLNLLDSFPLSVPIPDWNEEHGDVSRNPMIKGTTTDEIESQVNVIPEYNTATATHYSSSANQEWNFGSCFWNNMPSIY